MSRTSTGKKKSIPYPKRVAHKVHNFGSLDDDEIIAAYLIGKKGKEYLLYCASDVLIKTDNSIEHGVGSFVICKKGNLGDYFPLGKLLFETKYKNDNRFCGWRNIGSRTLTGESPDVLEFVNEFVKKPFTNKSLWALTKRLNKQESKMLKSWLKIAKRLRKAISG